MPTKLSRTYSSGSPRPHSDPPPGESSQRVEVGVGVEEPAVGTVRAHDGVEVAADSLAVLAQHLRLVHELVEADLPVGRVGVLGRDAQRHLLAAAADPDRRELLDRLRVAVRAVEVEVLAVERDRLLGPQPLHDLERLLEDRAGARRRVGYS